MSQNQTPDQSINRVIDRLKDILDKGNLAEKRQLAQLLGNDEVSVYCALCEVEDDMQERLDLGWAEEGEGENDSELSPGILPFPVAEPRTKKKIAKR